MSGQHFSPFSLLTGIVFSAFFCGAVFLFSQPVYAGAPSYVGSGGMSCLAGAVNPALPSGIAGDDILLLFVETANQATTIASGTNWATGQVVSGSPQGTGTAGSTSATRLSVFHAVYEGLATAPTTNDSGNHQCGVVLAFRGVDVSPIWEATGAGVNTTGPTTLTITGTSTSVSARSLLVVAAADDWDNASATRYTSWTTSGVFDGTERVDGGTATQNGGGLGIATAIKSVAGSLPDSTVAQNSSILVNGFMSIVLKPRTVTYTQAAYRFFENQNVAQLNIANALANQDTAPTLTSTGEIFRLQTLVHIDNGNFDSKEENFKLQYAQKSGTCDTSFSGESYADVTTSTAISYYDNSFPADGDAGAMEVGALSHSGHTIVNQTYEEANNFTSIATTTVLQDAFWDFALYDNGASASTSYCLRIVKSGGGTLNTYNVVPEIITAAAAASLTFSLSHDNFANLSPGTPRFATTTLSVNTSNSTGWYVTLSGDDQSNTDTVMDLSTDASIGITDQAEWIAPTATTSAGNAVRISSFDNSGDVLAFRVMTASGSVAFRAGTWWGTTDNYTDTATTLWAGIASSTVQRQIGNAGTGSYSATTHLSTVLYYLDVPTTQQTGTYTGGLTYTATAN